MLAARIYTTQALANLAQIMIMGKNESARVMAAKILLERGWGAPGQKVNVAHTLDDKAVQAAAERIAAERLKEAEQKKQLEAPKRGFLEIVRGENGIATVQDPAPARR